MSKTNDGGPAFPVPMIPVDDKGGYTDIRYGGMTLRDWFAGMAMQGLAGWERSQGLPYQHKAPQVLGDSARFAYQLADAMLKAREETR